MLAALPSGSEEGVDDVFLLSLVEMSGAIYAALHSRFLSAELVRL